MTWKKGEKRPPEFCEKIRTANIGRPCSPETREKMSKALKGRKRTPEQRQRISEGAKTKRWDKYWQEKKEREIAAKAWYIELNRNTITGKKYYVIRNNFQPELLIFGSLEEIPPDLMGLFEMNV